MSRHSDYEAKTEALVIPILDKYHYEFVDVEFIKEAGSWHLRVYIDKEGGITLDDLTTVNHELSDLMDKEDFIEEAYILEVSSPGLFRPFKKKRDYMRNIGEDVEVKLYSPVTWEEQGKRYSDKEFIAILKEYREADDHIVLDMEDSKLDIPVDDIALIRRYITF